MKKNILIISLSLFISLFAFNVQAEEDMNNISVVSSEQQIDENGGGSSQAPDLKIEVPVLKESDISQNIDNQDSSLGASLPNGNNPTSIDIKSTLNSSDSTLKKRDYLFFIIPIASLLLNLFMIVFGIFVYRKVKNK